MKGILFKNEVILWLQRDKSATQQELGLIKLLASDDQISRNIPGKVRVSAPLLYHR